MTATELMDQKQQQQQPATSNQRLSFHNNNNNNNNNSLKLNEFWSTASSGVKLLTPNGSGSTVGVGGGFSNGDQSPLLNGDRCHNQQTDDSGGVAAAAAAAAAAANFLSVQQQNQLMNSMAALAALQQQSVSSASNGSGDISGAASPDKLTEKLVNDLQIFMHKSAMQMHAARDMTTSGRAAMIASAVAGGAAAAVAGQEIKPHQCQQCLKSFSSNHQLVQHIRVHTGEKPYKCTYCERRFKQLSHVQQHTRLHTGERPYKCHLTDCGRAFIQLSNLQQHLRNHDAQMERAKNRPFHCNICGKGFATESSLRTHTSKCIGRLQQHAAMIGGPSPTTCPICQKIFLGSESLMDHMKIAHKDPNTTTSGVARWLHALSFNTFNDAISTTNAPSSSSASTLPMTTTAINTSVINTSTAATSPSNTAASMLIDPYLAKRRNANHPCPVCGKHYVNEGSLRKHLACHPETAQISNSLRMWPCSVCQAVFTHESGLLSHMEHMRMDPKHQFAAQYVLSRAAAERRDRDTIIAAVNASNAAGLLNLASTSSPMCLSPGAQSDTSSNNDRISLDNSESGPNNNNNNNSACSKLGEMLRISTAQTCYTNTDNGANSAAAAVQVAAANLAAAALRMQQQQSSTSTSSLLPNGPSLTTGSETLHSIPTTAPTVNDIATFRMHQQAEALLRSQAEAALRLAVSQAAAAVVSQTPASTASSMFYSQPTITAQQHHQNQMSNDLNEALRIQEHHRLHNSNVANNETKSLNFSLVNAVTIAATAVSNNKNHL